MFDLVNGIPVHPLVVHAIVVLLPLTVVGTLALAAVPRWRVTYGPLVIASALLSTVLTPVATSSGEELEERVGEAEDHAEMGEMLIWFAIPLLVLVTAMWWLARRQARTMGAENAKGGARIDESGPSKGLVTAVVVLAVVAALATSVQVYRVGDSGAKAVWDDASSSTNESETDD